MHEPAKTADPDLPHQSDRAECRSIRFTYTTGDRPLGGYTIKRGVGVGGFGEVYYATSEAGKDVALKRIQRHLAVEVRGVSQCLNLKHPNLVALYDIKYDDDGQAWVVMEYITGESLQDVIDRHPNGMSHERVNHWFRGIVDGVGYLHDHGIVHRDLKPGNIFIDEGQIKIGDYGLSKFISCSRRSGHTESVGTFHYMAPEIGRGRYGREIDVYSLGILLFEMLTGRVPFEGESSQEIIMKHLTAEPDISQIPPPYRSIVANAMYKDPERRTGRAADMLIPLESRTSRTPQAVSDPTPIRDQVVPPTLPGTSTARFRRQAKEKATSISSRLDRNEEPIARTICKTWLKLKRKWGAANLPPAAKFLLFFVGAVLLLVNSAWLLPLLSVLAFVYAGYLGLFVLFTSPTTPPALPTAQTATVAPIHVQPRRKPITKCVRRKMFDSHARDLIGQQPAAARITELLGSLLSGAFVAAVMCVAMLIIGNRGLEQTFSGMVPYFTWMTVTTIGCAWAILFLSKFWETTTGDQTRRRVCLLGAGLLVGALSWGLAQFLIIQPTYVLGTAPPSWLSDSLYLADGTPALLGYMGYFGSLFLVLRWWRLADPLRPSRFGLWVTGICAFWAVVLHMVLPFPRGFMVAAITAVVVQISAPWVSVRRRNEIEDSMEGTWV